MSSKNSQGQPYPLEHYDRTMRWHDDLSRRFTHRALDVPEDEVNNVGNKSGMGWRELLVIGAIIFGIAWIAVRTKDPRTPTPPPTIQAPAQPAAQPPPAPPEPVEVDILFWDQYGDPIDVPRRPKQGGE